MANDIRKRFVILGFVGIGDMIQFSPCLRILREGFPNAEIVLVTIWKGVHDLFFGNPQITESIYFDFLNAKMLDKFRFIRRLRSRNFDVSILPYPSFRREFNIVSWLVGARERYGFNFDEGLVGELAFLNNYRIKVNRHAHNLENNLSIMTTLGAEFSKPESYELHLTHTDSFLDDFLQKMNVDRNDFKIGIHPGSDRRGRERRLDISKFAEVCEYLVEKYHAKVFLFLGPHEEELKDEFQNKVRRSIIIVEKLAITKVAQLISTCQLFISSDSGLMHLASALGIPLVTIFGPTNPSFVRPWGVPHEIVSAGLSCSPCFFFTEKHPLSKPLIECKIEDKFACMKEIQSQDVIEKVDKLIALLYAKK